MFAIDASSSTMEFLMSMYDMEMIKRHDGIKFLLCQFMYKVISKMLLKGLYEASRHKKVMSLLKEFKNV